MKLFPNFTRHHLITHTNLILDFYKARRCESLFPPSHGVIVGQCRTEYLSVCRMACSEGFEAVSSVERKCVVSPSGVMVWTGSPLLCEGEYLQPPN